MSSRALCVSDKTTGSLAILDLVPNKTSAKVPIEVLGLKREGLEQSTPILTCTKVIDSRRLLLEGRCLMKWGNIERKPLL